MIDNDINSTTFNSYASVDDCKSYAELRGYSLPNEDSEIEKMLILAMDYLESKKWKGRPANQSQPLSWPRIGIIKDGYPIEPDVIPKQIKDAQCYLAIESQETDLLPSVEGGQEVLSETVTGAVSITYAEGTSKSNPSFPALRGLLRDLCLSDGVISVSRG